MPLDRRSVLKGTGAAVGASLFSTTGAAAGRAIDDYLDLDTSELQEALLILEPGVDYGFLDQFELPEGRYEMEALDIVYTKATGPELKAIGGHNKVNYVQANREVQYDNGDAQVATKAGIVQDGLGYTGRGVHVAVIDSGLDGYHPDLRARTQNHFQLANPLGQGPTFARVPTPSDTDGIGHGTHCAGTVLGEGKLNSNHEGMAPDADLTLYSVGAGLLILSTIAPFNHLLENVHPEDPVHVTSNSYGAISGQGRDFNPNGGWERATWRAFQAGILTCGSAGNSGPDPNTLGPQKTGPHTLSVAASHDGQGNDGVSDTKRPTNFSSRGRTADNDNSEGARWNEFPAEDGGYTGEDRGTGLQNLRALKSSSGSSGEREVFNEFQETVTVGPGVDAGVAGGPDTGTSVFVKYEPVEKARNVKATLSWVDGTQDIDLFLHEGAEDGPVLAGSTAGQTTAPSPGGGELESIAVDIDPTKTYYFEIDPWVAVQAQCTLSVAERGSLSATSDAESAGDAEGPMGVYRPGVIAPGNAVVSVQGASGFHGLEATGGPSAVAETGPFYAAASGTSMSCPVVAGICAQVIEAWYTNNGEEYPSPEQVIRIIEGTAQSDVEEVYTPYNAGAGFVNAKKAVEAAIAGEVPDYTEIRLPEDDKGDAAE
jgi:serine protease AprX